MKKIATIHTDFPEKFGIPRQSNLADARGKIVFEPEYRNPDAVRGIEEYSYLWIIWEFSESIREDWSPTVRPPRLGGNKRVGVFATRSPFRPNPLGLSSVRLEKVEIREDLGPVLHVVGVDMLDGTPVYDIKPYLPYVDSHPDAEGGFGTRKKGYELLVEWDDKWNEMVPVEKRETLRRILAQDPRPAYQNDPERIYGMMFSGLEIKFRVREGCLKVISILRCCYG